MSHVFLSYAREDAAIMQRVYDGLRAMELDVWSDADLIPGTEDWQDAIEDTIEQCVMLVVLMSPAAKESEWVRREINYARVQRKLILPVLVQGSERDAVPLLLIGAQWLEMRQQLEEAVSKLADTVRAYIPPPEDGQTVKMPSVKPLYLNLPEQAFIRQDVSLTNSESADKPVLLIHEGSKAVQRWTIRGDELVLGRGSECDLVLPERQISREHVRIFRDKDSFYIEDLESKNGTWLNGKQMKGTVLLRDGDEIQLALAVKLTFIGPESTEPLPVDELPDSLGRLQLNRDSRRVFINGIEVDPPLSLPQYRLLELLYDGAGAVRTRDEVIESVWPSAVGENVSKQAIELLVRRLRNRLAEVDPDYQYVVTVRGHGYRLDNPA